MTSPVYTGEMTVVIDQLFISVKIPDDIANIVTVIPKVCCS